MSFLKILMRQELKVEYAPNGMWTYFVSVYYMANKDEQGMLDDGKFYKFLNKITAFIWAYAVTNPGVNALRTPIFAEMINVVNGKPITFNEFLFNTQQVQNAFQNYSFTNNRAITKSHGGLFKMKSRFCCLWRVFSKLNTSMLAIEMKRSTA